MQSFYIHMFMSGSIFLLCTLFRIGIYREKHWTVFDLDRRVQWDISHQRKHREWRRCHLMQNNWSWILHLECHPRILNSRRSIVGSGMLKTKRWNRLWNLGSCSIQAEEIQVYAKTTPYIHDLLPGGWFGGAVFAWELVIYCFFTRNHWCIRVFYHKWRNGVLVL